MKITPENLLCKFFSFAEYRNNGAYKQTAYKVADSVRNVKGKSCCNPSQHTSEIKTEKQCLCRSIQHSVKQSVQCTNSRINYRFRFIGDFFRNKHCHSPENCPYVEIWYPPCAEAVHESCQQHKNVKGIKCFPPVNYRHGNDKCSDKMYIRKHFHYHFRCIHQCSEHAENGNVNDFQLHYSALNSYETPAVISVRSTPVAP